ncbi:unnamed protein product [Amaranthus hypochondriacus]
MEAPEIKAIDVESVVLVPTFTGQSSLEYSSIGLDPLELKSNLCAFDGGCSGRVASRLGGNSRSRERLSCSCKNGGVIPENPPEQPFQVETEQIGEVGETH